MLWLCVLLFTSAHNHGHQSPLLWASVLHLIVNVGSGWPDTATSYLIYNTPSSTFSLTLPAPAVSASLASVSFNEFLTGSQALAFSTASLSQGSDSLSLSLDPIQRLKWLPFLHGIEPPTPPYPMYQLSLSLSINPSLSFLAFLLSFAKIPYTTLSRCPFFIGRVLQRHTKASVDAESPGACIWAPAGPTTQYQDIPQLISPLSEKCTVPNRCLLSSVSLCIFIKCLLPFSAWICFKLNKCSFSISWHLYAFVWQITHRLKVEKKFNLQVWENLQLFTSLSRPFKFHLPTQGFQFNHQSQYYPEFPFV